MKNIVLIITLTFTNLSYVKANSAMDKNDTNSPAHVHQKIPLIMNACTHEQALDIYIIILLGRFLVAIMYVVCFFLDLFSIYDCIP